MSGVLRTHHDDGAREVVLLLKVLTRLRLVAAPHGGGWGGGVGGGLLPRANRGRARPRTPGVAGPAREMPCAGRETPAVGHSPLHARLFGSQGYSPSHRAVVRVA